MKNNILDFSIEEINQLLQLVEDIQIKPLDSNEYQIPNWFRNVYFVGGGLCIDITKENGKLDVMTFSHREESVGYFSGGMRRLISMTAVRTLERIMERKAIQHHPKWKFT
jgi:hypothetical protein